MSQTFRHPEIIEIARKDGKVIVDDLARHFRVSVQTIRRDLADLDEAGELTRVHGGAVLPSGVSNIEYQQRRDLNEDAKNRIAKACADRIPSDSSVFLNIGTSTEAVANNLLRHRNLLAFTNNINVANILIDNPECEVLLTGGALRRTDGGLIGSQTMRAIEQYKYDFAIIGCSAVDVDGDLLDFDIQEVGVSQTIIRQARKVFLVADHSKIHRNAPAKICSMSEIDICFTDQPFVGDLATKCADWQTEIVVA